MKLRRTEEPRAWDLIPPTPDPTPEEIHQLLTGQTVYRHGQAHDASTGLSMALSRASSEAVWSVILDFDGYVRFLPYVSASWVESREQLEGGMVRTLWGMELTTRGVVTRYSVESRYVPGARLMRWEMVPRGASPMARAHGYWTTGPWVGEAGRTLVVYGADVATAWWLPGPIHRKAADKGLPQIVGLVSARAEQARSGVE